MTAATTATAVGGWVTVALIGYLVLAYVLLFYLPPAERLRSGAIADAVFVTTLPFILFITWLAAVRD